MSWQANSMMDVRRRAVLVGVCAGILAQYGCREDEKVTDYLVSKPPPADATAPDQPRDRLLGAIIPRRERTWFFKVTGRADALAKHVEAFQALVRSVRFAGGEDSAPAWTLPPGWQQQPPSGMRFATLRFGPQEAPFELTVIPLPSPAQHAETYALSNVNRWRRQLSLPPITAQQMEKDTNTLKLDGATATVVSLLGRLEQKRDGRPPFMSGQLTPGPDLPPQGDKNAQ